MPETLSIIICTKDRIEEALVCLRSIFSQTLLPKEIVIVDSTKGFNLKKAVDLLKKPKEINLKYINREANLTKARNIGLDESMGDIVMFLDDDTVLDEDYIKEIAKVFAKDREKKVGGVSGNIVDKRRKKENFFKGLIQDILGFLRNAFNTAFFLFKYGDGKFRLSGIQTFARQGVNEIMKVECLSGANMSFRREVINAFRFDEKSSYSEDDDIAYRISRKYHNIYTPFAKLVHNWAAGGGYGSREKRMKKEIEGLYYHFQKNLPQNFKHISAFWIAMLGIFLKEIINLVFFRKKSWERLKGVARGIKSILFQKSFNQSPAN